MIRDEIVPAIAYKAAPASVEEAANRIRNFGVHSSSESFYGLAKCVFKDVEQFTKAMSECRWNVRVDDLMDGASKTYKATALGSDGCEWRFLLDQAGPFHLEVVNCKMTKVGVNLDPDAQILVGDMSSTLKAAAAQ